MSVGPIRYPRDAGEQYRHLTNAVSFILSSNKPSRPFVRLWFHQRLTQASPIPGRSSYGLWVGFTWREETPSTCLLAGPKSQASLLSLIRADPFLLHLAENTMTCDYPCLHVRYAPNRRQFENPNLGPCNCFDRMSSYPTVDRLVNRPNVTPLYFSPRRDIVTFTPLNGWT